MNFEARYEFTYPLFMKANRLFRGKNVWTFLLYWFFWGVFPVGCLIVAGIMIAGSVLGSPANHQDSLSSALIFVGYAVFLWGLRWYCFRRAYRNIFPGKVSRRDCFLAFSDAGVHTEMAGVAQSEWNWQAFCRVVADDKLALVLLTKTKFLCIPRESLNHADWDQFVAFLQSKVASTKC